MLHIATYFPDYWGGKHRGAGVMGLKPAMPAAAKDSRATGG